LSSKPGYLPLLPAAVVALASSFYLDGLITGAGGGDGLLYWASRLMSLVGDGGFLIAVSAVLYAAGRIRRSERVREAARLSFSSLILSGVVAHLLKAAFERPRPAHAPASIVQFLTHPTLFDLTGRYNSFPSGHTLASFAFAYTLSTRFPRLRAPLYLAALLVAASRVYLGSHYPSDVAAGALIGLGVGWLIAGRVAGGYKWLVAGLLLLTVFISFFKPAGFMLFDVDEAVFSEASREMVETRDVITPTYNYEPRYDKPVLFYWFQSASYALGGVNEAAARFPSGLFGVLLISITFLFMSRVSGALTAVFTSLALLLNIEFFVYTHSAVTDMTLAFFIAASLYSFYLGASGGSERWFAPAWASAALATLTKGAIGIVFPASIAFFYLLATRETAVLKKALRPAYILLFLVIAAPWFAAESYVNGWEFFNAFVLKHHIARFSSVISSHSGPPYYYVFVLLIGFFPWVAFVPGGLWKGLKERESGFDGGRPGLFFAVWFIFVFVFFSISRTKLPNYVFPLYPAASALAGLCISGLIRGGRRRAQVSLYVLVALSALLSAAAFALPSMQVGMDPAFPERFFYVLGAIFAAMTVLSLTAFYSTLPSLAGLSGVMVVLIVFLRLHALPTANLHLQKTLYDYASYARSCPSPTVLSAYEINKPSLAFYAAQRVKKIEGRALCDVGEFSKKGRFLLITTPSKYEGVEEFKDLNVIERRDDYMLLGNTTCPGRP